MDKSSSLPKSVSSEPVAFALYQFAHGRAATLCGYVEVLHATSWEGVSKKLLARWVCHIADLVTTHQCL